MSDFKIRLVNESEDLKDKLDKLTVFIKSENFNKIDDIQKILLINQQQAMTSYSTILDIRLSKLE